MPDELYQELKRQALVNHRSLNSEAIVSLSLVVNKKRMSSQTILSNAQTIRVKENQMINLTNETLNNIKQDGRL